MPHIKRSTVILCQVPVRDPTTVGAGAIVGSISLFRQEEVSDPTPVPAQRGYWVPPATTLGTGAIVGSISLFRQEEVSDPTSVPAQG